MNVPFEHHDLGLEGAIKKARDFEKKNFACKHLEYLCTNKSISQTSATHKVEL